MISKPRNNIKFLILTVLLVVAILGIFSLTRNDLSESIADPVVVTEGSKSEILKVTEADNIRGEKNSPVTIIVYSDYQCPYCITYDRTLAQVVAAYPGKVRLAYRHFPLPFHKAAKGAAIAAEAAGLQGKYWEFHDKLVENSQPDGGGLAEKDLSEYAGEIGLNVDKFKADLKNNSLVKKVELQTKAGNSLGIRGTPSSYLINKNGEIEDLDGALSLEDLKTTIESALSK
ncbi:MAG TPA: DsbA family protein [bacterium]|nr:DsbA family protein [bacterium]